MAKVHIVLAGASAYAPVMDSIPVKELTATSSGSSAVAAIAADSPGQIWSLISDGDVWVKFGKGAPVAGEATTSPAAIGGGWMLLAGVPLERAALGKGETVAIKDKT